jgi:hypothetical protein
MGVFEHHDSGNEVNTAAFEGADKGVQIGGKDARFCFGLGGGVTGVEAEEAEFVFHIDHNAV